MSARDARTVVLEGPPSHRSEWYRALARLLASAGYPAAVLREDSLAPAAGCLTVRPPELVDVVRASLAGTSVRVAEADGVGPRPPPRLRHHRFGTVVRAGEQRFPSPERRAVLVDRLGTGPALEANSWLAVQTIWLPGGHGTLWLARRFWLAVGDGADADRRGAVVGAAVAAEWSLRTGVPATFRDGGHRARREWLRGGSRTVPRDGWFECVPDVAAEATRGPGPAADAGPELPVETPAIVLGASGAGKTTYLARWSAQVLRRGGALFALDLHGDLAPAIVARLSPAQRERLVAVDGTRPPVPGVAGLVSDGSPDRAAAHLVAALKRLSPDGSDLYWGFRLERIFDTFVRLALESGGSLTDLYDLLTNPDRRDAARLATRSLELARFLDELAPVVRRNPEFLWSAATRLSKVVLVPSLRELLAPADGGMPVESLLAEGRSLLVRLPFASLGPEAVGFAATLVLGRVYLGLAAAAQRRGRPNPVAVVLDEVQALSPRLVAELLTEGRKFGLRALVATQYPDRLARELEGAARGALRGFVTFRVPPASAREVGTWLGLAAADSAELLPNLPPGEGLVRDSLADGVRPTAPDRVLPPPGDSTWNEALVATQEEFGAPVDARADVPEGDLGTERLLLAVLSRSEEGSPVDAEDLVRVATELPGSSPDAALMSDRLREMLRDGLLLERGADGLRLTPAGERRLGLTTATGATRESAEHRALLVTAFRLFARRGYRLEILRQGRFDTTLPDARFRQLPDGSAVSVPSDLADALERARAGWAWRFFRGRDVHVEAEVSGALRPERIRHGVRKALHRGAFVVFVVGDAQRARRVRSVVRSMGLGVDRAQVWTLRCTPSSRGRSAETNR